MNNRIKLFIPIVFFICMTGLLLFGLFRDPNKVPSALINRPLPQFSLPSLDGPVRASSEISGGFFLVNVWATWCPPCHIEHPYLMQISEEESGVTLVGVNYKDDLAAARQFLDEKGNPFEFVVVDSDGSLGIDLGVAGAPETFLVDANGTIRYRHVGVIDDSVWEDTFVPLMQQIVQ